jgi:hypothetical protein
LRYSWSKFGREAEYVVALYLKSSGWSYVSLSPGSRGPADITASHRDSKWFIQVKASSGLPRLRSREVSRLKEFANERKGLAVLSTLQPFASGAFLTGNFAINFYEIDSWKNLDPALPISRTAPRLPSL